MFKLYQRFRNWTNRREENSPATASFFKFFRPIPGSIVQIAGVYKFVRESSVILESLKANGGRESKLRRRWRWPTVNYRLVTTLSKMVKLSHCGFVFNNLNPVVLKLAIQTLKFSKLAV